MSSSGATRAATGAWKVSACKLDGTDQAATLNAEIASLSTFGGGTITLPGGSGAIKCNSTITLADGVRLAGAGASPTSGGPTRFDFTALPVGSRAILLPGLSDVGLSNFYVSGWTAGGTASVIATSGNCRRINIEGVTVNAVTSATAFDIGPTGYCIESTLTRCTAVSAAYGFNVGSACTSITLTSCYANGCSTAGYLIQGTYLDLVGCATDTNTLFGYLIQGAKAVTLLACGAESNGRTGFFLTGSDSITLISPRGVNNNTSAGPYVSLVSINDGATNTVITNPVDTTPNGASSCSIGNYQGALTDTVWITGGEGVLAKGVAANVTNRAKRDAYRTVAASTALVASDNVVAFNGATLTATLPDPTTVYAGRQFTVVNINASALTVVSAGAAKTVAGAASQAVAQWAKPTYTSDGAQWL